MTRALLPLLASLLFLAGCLATSTRPGLSPRPGARTVRALRAAAPPELDGRLDDTCWQEVDSVSGFLLRKTDTPATYQSFGFVCYDEAHIYVAVKCLMPAGQRPAGEPRPGSDAPVWGGDELIEVMIDPGVSGAEYFQFVVSAYGAVYDVARREGGTASDDAWHGDWQAAANIADGYWSAELAIPYHTIGITSQTGSTWGINLCRDAAVEDHFELSSIAVNGVFNNASQFALLLGVDADFRKYAFEVGPCTAELSIGDQPRLHLAMPVRNRTGRTRRVTIDRYVSTKDGVEKATTARAILREGQFFLLPMETLFAEPPLVRGGRAYHRSAAPVTRRIVVAEAENGAALKSVNVTQPVHHLAMDLSVENPWHRTAADRRTTAVRAAVILNVADEERNKGTLEVVLQSPSGEVAVRKTRAAPAKSTSFRLPVQDIPWDAYLVRAVFKDGTGRAVLATQRQAPVLPGGAQRIRVLNNFVSELMNMRERGLLEQRHIEFLNPRDGWCFFTFAGETEILLDDLPTPILPAPVPFGDPTEAMRYLSAGRHKLTIRPAGDRRLEQLIVRAIPVLQYDYYDAKPHIAPHGPYDWSFMSRHVLPHINTMVSVGGVPPQPEHIAAWKRIGRRWIRQENRPDGAGLQIDSDAEDAAAKAYEHWAASPGYRHPLMDGILVDEFSGSDDPVFAVYGEAVHRLNGDFGDRTFTPYIGGETYFWGLDRSARLGAAALAGGGYLAPEYYLTEQATPDAARDHIEKYLVKAIAKWDKAIPDILPRVIPILSFLASPPESCSIHPTADFKVYMDMQMRALATDARCFGLGGVQWYRPSYCDEEYLRWAMRLFRHYCIEGRIEPATGDPYILTHLQNPDFADDTVGWDVQAAEADSVRAAGFAGFGHLQGRYVYRANVGDTFLVMRRSGARPNVVRQRLRNLQPGRLYCMKMITGDYGDLTGGISRQTRHALSIHFADATVSAGAKNAFQFPYRCGSWIKVGKFDGRRNPYWMNYHWRVFQAHGRTAELLISDWKDEDEPGGPAGQELTLNFVEVQPYWKESYPVTNPEMAE